ncbi:MAG: hypothetical protein ABJF10_27255 [Chthoniobacter sp.]|uniref:hypothetical protein n=1 Tax=Chthoniobacter sp. TaxID=2510640 RepID=UPI0032A3D777
MAGLLSENETAARHWFSPLRGANPSIERTSGRQLGRSDAPPKKEHEQMKTTALTVIAVVATAAFAINACGQTPAIAATGQVASPKNNDQLRAFLCAQPWSWERPSEQPQTLSFGPSGKVTNNSWVAHYTIVDLHKVTFRMNNQTARITFSDDYNSYTGLDFNGATPVSGKPKRPQ